MFGRDGFAAPRKNASHGCARARRCRRNEERRLRRPTPTACSCSDPEPSVMRADSPPEIVRRLNRKRFLERGKPRPEGMPREREQCRKEEEKINEREREDGPEKGREVPPARNHGPNPKYARSPVSDFPQATVHRSCVIRPPLSRHWGGSRALAADQSTASLSSLDPVLWAEV